jgi:NAD(P)-dependent dehydrogenase (short-subunit alcohol dehydrogenase family)
MPTNKTAIVTGAQQGIGAGLVEGFLEDGYSVVATSLHASDSLHSHSHLIVVGGDLREQETAAKTVGAAITHFGAVDVLVNNAGVFITKPFTEFTAADFHALVSVNLLGFLNMTQLVVQQRLKQGSGCVITISAALADNPIAGVARFKKDAAAQKALSQTAKLADMKSENFDTVFYVGGHAAIEADEHAKVLPA